MTGWKKESLDKTRLSKGKLSDFLENAPPNTKWLIPRCADYNDGRITLPRIKLHCPECEGIRSYSSVGSFILDTNPSVFCATYTCLNCEDHEKIFALYATITLKNVDLSNSDKILLGLGLYDLEKDVEIIKIGEHPPCGSVLPPKTNKFLGKDRDLFFKGRRCENQGLGIGAFIYYRRLVENQRNRIFKEIIKICENSSSINSGKTIETLNKALEEKKFSESLKIAKKEIPEVLFIKDKNPMELLYMATSEGLHNHTDEKCLEIAQNIRVILVELADRLSQILKNDSAVKEALKVLENIK